METVRASSDLVSEKAAIINSFYSPGLLAAYCIIANLPFGFFLYGLNVYRRGHVTAGRITMALCSVAIIGQSIVLALGMKIINLPIFLFNIVVSLGLMNSERTKYEKLIAAGARPAKWWPPLLFLLANVVVVYLLAEIFEHNSVNAN